MTLRRFRQIDVFGSGPFTGNPVAVVLDAEGLTTAQMQQISAWTNLSECTFVLPTDDPAADYRARIFSLRTELPFAGHPTLGTARAWLDAGGQPRDPARLVQECGAGLVPVRTDPALAFAAPPLVRSGEVDAQTRSAVVHLLGLAEEQVRAVRWVDNGPGWIGVLVRDAQTVLDVRLSAAAGTGPWAVGVAGPYDSGQGPAGAVLEVRAFFGDGGAPLFEDPVTGSLNASLAQWLLADGELRAPYTASQGTVIGRAGRVHLSREGEQVWVAGETHVAVRGEIETD